MKKLSNEELLALACSDPSAFGDLLERYRSFLNIVAKSEMCWRLRRRVSASDLTQNTFTKAATHFTSFRGSGLADFVGWLKTIHENELKNLRSRHAAEMRDPARERAIHARMDSGSVIAWYEPSAHGDTPLRRLVRNEHALQVAEAIESLPPDQAEAVRLRYLENMSHSEIADALDTTPTATAGLVKRGLKTLRNRLIGTDSRFRPST